MRGSGQNIPENQVGSDYFVDKQSQELTNLYKDAGVVSEENQTAKFIEEFHSQIPTGVKYVSLHNQISSTGQQYNKYGYVATSAFDAVAVPFNGYRQPPSHRKDVSNAYYESVKDGAEELAWYLEDQMTSCPLQRVVLGGYSQGAETVTDGINILKPGFRARIAFTALYGDPKYNSVASYVPYKIGNWVRGNTVNSITHGVLDARVPYVPDVVSNLGSWCAAGDLICDAGTFDTYDAKRVIQMNVKFNNDTHGNIYQDTWIPKSMAEIIRAVRLAVPDAEYGLGTSVYINKDDKLWNLDLAIVIDNSSSMQGSLQTVTGNVGGLSGELLGSYWNSRVGVVTYNGTPDTEDPGHVYASVVTPFTNNQNDVAVGLRSIRAEQPYYGLFPDGSYYRIPELSAQYSGIMTAVQGLQWQLGAQKKIIVITNNPVRSPDPSPNHWTSDQVRQAAFNLDPAALSLADVSCDNTWSCDPAVDTTFQELADDSGGQVSDINLSFGTVDDLSGMLQHIEAQPVAELSGQQSGYAGVALDLNGDESYGPNASITEYDWDCTSDNHWDSVTAWPTNTCTYGEPGDYLVTLRVWSSDTGQAALATMPVHIVAGSPPVVTPPEQPNAALSYSSTGALLTWTNHYADGIYLRISDADGNLIGYAPANATGVLLGAIGSDMTELHVSAGASGSDAWSDETIVPLDHDQLAAIVPNDDADVFTVVGGNDSPTSNSNPTPQAVAPASNTAVHTLLSPQAIQLVSMVRSEGSLFSTFSTPAMVAITTPQPGVVKGSSTTANKPPVVKHQSTRTLVWYGGLAVLLGAGLFGGRWWLGRKSD